MCFIYKAIKEDRQRRLLFIFQNREGTVKLSKKGLKKGFAIAVIGAVAGGQILASVPANVLAEESNQGKGETKSVQPRAIGLNYKNTFDALEFSPASPNSLKIKASSNALISLGIANQGVQRIQIDPEFKEFFQDPNWKSYLSGTMYIRAGAAGLYTNTQQISTVAANQGANRSRIEFDANNNTLNLYGEQVLASTTMNMTNDIFIDLAKWNKDRKMSGYTSVIERKPSYTFKVDAVDPDYISLNFGTNNLADKSITDNSMTWFENSWMENSIEPTTLQSTDNKTFKGKTVQDRINEHPKDYTVELYTNNTLITKDIPVDTAGNWNYKGTTVYPAGTMITAKVVGKEREPNANGIMDVSYSKVTNLTLGAPDEAPVIHAFDKKIEQGSAFSPLSGVTAIDAEDGDITGDIQVNSTVDVNVPGQYTVTYTVTDSVGNVTKKVITVEVVAKTIQQGVLNPNSYNIGDGFVTGTFSGGVKRVALEVNGVVYGQVNVLDSVNFRYYAKDKVTSASNSVYIVGYDASGRQLDRKQVLVNGASTAAGTVYPSNYRVGDGFVTGTYSGSVKKVALEVNGSVYSKVDVLDGTNFRYYAKDKVASTSYNVYVIGYDASGRQVDRKKVNLSGAMTNSGLSPAAYKIGDGFVTGTYSGNIKQVALVVNGLQYSSVGVLDSSNFRYYAKDKVRSTSDSVYIAAYDYSGLQVDKKMVPLY